MNTTATHQITSLSFSFSFSFAQYTCHVYGIHVYGCLDQHPLFKRLGEFTLIRIGEVLYEHIFKDTDLQVQCAFRANLHGGNFIKWREHS